MNTSGAATTVAISKYRWVVLFACWTSFTLTSIDRSTWGPASIYVGDGLGVPLASLGAFATAYFVGYLVSNAVGGMLSDAIGGRLTLTVSLFGAGALMVVFGSTTNAAVGIAVQAAIGLFAGAEIAGIKLVTGWFRPQELGLAVSIQITAAWVGLGVGNAVVPALIAWHGWQTSYRLFGGISIGVACLLFFLLKPGPLGASAATRNTSDRRRLLPEFVLLLRNRNFLVLCIGGFGLFWAFAGFIAWANALMIKGHQVSPETAGWVLVVFSAVAVVSQPMLGYISDRFFADRRKQPIIVLTTLYGISLIVFGTLSSTTSFYWIAAVLGVVAGSTALITAFVPALVPAAVVGTAAGASSAVWALSATVVPMVVGAVFAGTGSFLAAFAALGAGPLIGAVLLLGIKQPRVEEAGHGTTISVDAATPVTKGASGKLSQ